MSPTSLTMRLAQVPRKIPNAVHSCHVMTKPPRMLAGATSAEKTGTVTSLRPMPMPSKSLHATSWPQVWLTAMPKGESRLKMAPRKIVPRLPIRLFRGSDSQPALEGQVLAVIRRNSPDATTHTYKRQIAM